MGTLSFCCGECFELERNSIVQAMSSSALTHVALHGRGFCASARSLAEEKSRPGIQTIHEWNMLTQLGGISSAIAVGLASGLTMWSREARPGGTAPSGLRPAEGRGRS